MSIYVASSWRNPWQPATVKLLRALGHEVYDFREPTTGTRGFSWRDIDPDWKDWTPSQYRANLDHPISQAGFLSDMNALRFASACVLVLPCGSSAHLELGYAIGAGKKTSVLFPMDIPITPIGGHVMDPCALCPICSSDSEDIYCVCQLPKRLHAIEPELMAKAADKILVSQEELILWAASIL
jgi:hypothetical protein